MGPTSIQINNWAWPERTVRGFSWVLQAGRRSRGMHGDGGAIVARCGRRPEVALCFLSVRRLCRTGTLCDGWQWWVIIPQLHEDVQSIYSWSIP